jgi:hypothetical protein
MSPVLPVQGWDRNSGVAATMSIDMDQDSERPGGNSRARSSGSLHLVVGVAQEVIAALDPDEAKYWVVQLSDGVFAAIEAWNATPVGD